MSTSGDCCICDWFFVYMMIGTVAALIWIAFECRKRHNDPYDDFNPLPLAMLSPLIGLAWLPALLWLLGALVLQAFTGKDRFNGK